MARLFGRRWRRGRPALRSPARDRNVARVAVWSAVAGFGVTGLAWVGATDGQDTQAFPHAGFVLGVPLLVSWLAVALLMLTQTRRPARV